MSVYNLLCTFSKKRSTFAPKFKISIKKNGKTYTTLHLMRMSGRRSRLVSVVLLANHPERQKREIIYI